MRNFNLLFTACFVVLITTIGFGQITGSVHDFSNGRWSSTQEVCAVCHVPHNAATGLAAPLWSHATSVATYTVYTSTSLDGVVGQPDGSSKLCLSCHDGTVAVDNYLGSAAGTELLTGKDNLGIDLSNNHPVSFTYDAALATLDGELYDPTIIYSGLGGTITNDLLEGGKMQCSSCHDVHRGPGVTGKLLVKSNEASALCLTCHNK